MKGKPVGKRGFGATAKQHRRGQETQAVKCLDFNEGKDYFLSENETTGSPDGGVLSCANSKEKKSIKKLRRRMQSAS